MPRDSGFSIVKGTDGLLRIDFSKPPSSDGPDPNLEPVDWDRWFRIFDDNNLQFLHDPEPQSRFFKLVSAESPQPAEHKPASKTTAARSRSRKKTA